MNYDLRLQYSFSLARVTQAHAQAPPKPHGKIRGMVHQRKFKELLAEEGISKSYRCPV